MAVNAAYENASGRRQLEPFNFDRISQRLNNLDGIVCLFRVCVKNNNGSVC